MSSLTQFQKIIRSHCLNFAKSLLLDFECVRESFESKCTIVIIENDYIRNLCCVDLNEFYLSLFNFEHFNNVIVTIKKFRN
jgi:hypothetical protein